MAAKQIQLPRGGYLNESGTARQIQLPTGGYLNEPATTSTIKQRRTIGVQRVGTRQAG